MLTTEIHEHLRKQPKLDKTLTKKIQRNYQRFKYISIMQAIVYTLLPENKVINYLFFGIIFLEMIAILCLIWQPERRIQPKKAKDADQLAYIAKSHKHKEYNSYHLFYKLNSLRPYIYIYNSDYQKVTRLSSKIQYDQRFRKELKELDEGQPIEMNGFLDEALTKLVDQTLPIVKF